MKMVDTIVHDVREFARDGGATFGLVKRKRSPFWCLRVFATGHRDKLISLKTSDKKIAAAYLDEVRARFREQMLNGIIPIRTADLIDEWLTLKEASIRSKSYCRYKAVTNKVTPFLPEQACQTTAATIERYKILMMREKYHPTTVIYHLQILRDLFTFAARLGYVRSNPLENVDYPKRPESEIVHYTPDELSAIFAELELRAREAREKQRNDMWEVYEEVFHCLNFTGLRISDALNLKWADVNLAFGVISLTQIKTGRVVHVRIPTAYAGRLKRLAETRDATSVYVYVNTAGHPVRYPQVDAAIRDVLKSTGIAKKSPVHSFRHTTAQRLLAAGVSVDAVAGQLGDQVETVVRTYVRPATASLAAIDLAYGALQSDNGNSVKPQFDLVSRKCPASIEENAVCGSDIDKLDKRPILQKAL
ncbi:MAG: tyrosine-type recombinase/integrase [bacterium]